MPRIALALGAAYLLALGLLAVVVERWAALDERRPALDAAERNALFAHLRADLEPPADGLPAPPVVPRVDYAGWATVHCSGDEEVLVSRRFVARAGQPLGAVGLGEGDAVRARRAGRGLAGCRIKADLEIGRGPIADTIEPLFSLSLIPGVDGLGLRYGDREIVLLPDDLMRSDLLAGHRPVPALDFEGGLDARGALKLLALRAGASADAWRRTPHRLFRFRVEGFIEPAAGTGDPLPVFRGNPPGPALSATALREAARRGARYLEHHLHDDGRFGYQYDTLADQELPDDSDYSVPRHAGAAWFLAQAAGAFPGEGFDRSAARALAWLEDNHPPGCDRPAWACAGGPAEQVVDLGSSALALLAVTEYQRRTGDARFAPFAARLAAFLAAMQLPEGEFAHLYDLAADRRDDATRLLYFSGEATFALARRAALIPDPALDDRVDRALAYLTGPAYGHFAARFYYGEDHWTCLALEAAWAHLPDAHRDRYLDFCEGFARFIRRSQFRAGDGPTRDQPDLVGAYGFTPLVAPHPTPVGSRSEALISVLALSTARGHGVAVRDITSALDDSMRFLLDHQISEDSAYLARRPDAAVGGFLMNDLKRQVRIDFIQHSCSAMLRYADRLEPADERAR